MEPARVRRRHCPRVCLCRCALFCLRLYKVTRALCNAIDNHNGLLIMKMMMSRRSRRVGQGVHTNYRLSLALRLNHGHGQRARRRPSRTGGKRIACERSQAAGRRRDVVAVTLLLLRCPLARRTTSTSAAKWARCDRLMQCDENKQRHPCTNTLSRTASHYST